MMPEQNVICKPELAPARQPIMKRLKAVVDARIKIQGGPASLGKFDGNQPPSLCIMEATSYILGYEVIDDGPPCTSECITELMIDLNDSVTDRQRAKLKQLIPEIINTAPLVWVIDKKNGCIKDSKTRKCLRDENGNKIYPEKLVRKSDDEDYVAAEEKRYQMLEDFMETQPKKKDNFGDFARPENNEIPMSKWIPFIQELAAVAKFNKQNDDTEHDFTTPAIDIDAKDNNE